MISKYHRITNTHLYFYKGPFSNWNANEFGDPLLNWTFSNTEQHFMYSKAWFFRDERSAVTALNTREPDAVKLLGRRVQNYDDAAWSTVRYGFMVYANYLKFSQLPEYKKTLLDTGDLTLVEASPYDGVWGVKLAIDDDAILDEANWQGQNLLGKALQDVRKMLKNT